MAGLFSELLGFRGVNDPGFYLGMPTLWGRSKKEALGYIVDRVKRKLEGWKQNTLSLGGKEVLLKSEAVAIPAYPMSCFLFPKAVCDSINSGMSKFWWGDEKIHWKKWADLGKSKSNGGLRFHDLHEFNLALLAKQCWRLLQFPDSIWAMTMKARYFPKCSFFQLKEAIVPLGVGLVCLQLGTILVGSRWQV
ncbi:uncharacterized mitochondrial protein AtMg00310-like [Argentina anserina]|uniref:uncharacterized mitochondrial protein AtMg00310-like n=1 Tax=Argentina anserina TaxID=57926 RepID=UPI0021767096|nr:uncharacterized mitochondrial protein AtMg00310-like [Potentilla anserina]